MDHLHPYQQAARNAADLYLEKLPGLVARYKEYKKETITVPREWTVVVTNGRHHMGYSETSCFLKDKEQAEKSVPVHCPYYSCHWCGRSCWIETDRKHTDEFVGRMFASKMGELTAYFTDLRAALPALVTRRAAFSLPDCKEVQRKYPRVNMNC